MIDERTTSIGRHLLQTLRTNQNAADTLAATRHPRLIGRRSSPADPARRRGTPISGRGVPGAQPGTRPDHRNYDRRQHNPE